MEYGIFIFFLVGLLLFAGIMGAVSERRSAREFRERALREFGALPQKRYTHDSLLHVPKYFEKHREAGALDDITWNDLDMDAVYRRLNYCHSAAGEEYLYYMLRTPKTTDDFAALEAHVAYVTAHAPLRAQLQEIFYRMRQISRYSVYDYLDYLDGLGTRSSVRHIAVLAMLALSAAGIVPFGGPCIALFVALLAFNSFTYFREKGEVEPYLTTFSNILRLLDGAERLRALPDEALTRQLAEIGPDLQALARFQRGSAFVLSMGRTGGGNPVDVIMDYVRILTHIDLMKFNQMLSEVRLHTGEIDHIITVLGRMDAELSIACYRASLKEDFCLPEFSDGCRIDDAYHPLLNDAVRNSIDAERDVLITGSNASGKSTFLKTCAIAAVMAQTVHTVTARRYRAAMYRIYTSMALSDDLTGGDSYYMVEIKSLKRILDAAKEGDTDAGTAGADAAGAAAEGNRLAATAGGEGPAPVLCFIDEVLRGTNTVERIAASAKVLDYFAALDGRCFAATHDIELTELLKERFDNYHFEDEVTEGDVRFSYRLQPGPATSHNAIQLLRLLGYEARIVDAADEVAERFLKEGVWRL